MPFITKQTSLLETIHKENVITPCRNLAIEIFLNEKQLNSVRESQYLHDRKYN